MMMKKNGPSGTWFNIGYDRACRTHFWNEDTSPSLLKQTIPAERPSYEYSVRDVSEALSVIADAAARNPEHLTFCFDCTVTSNDCKELIDKFIEYSGAHHCTYYVNERMQTLTIYGQ